MLKRCGDFKSCPDNEALADLYEQSSRGVQTIFEGIQVATMEPEDLIEEHPSTYQQVLDEDNVQRQQYDRRAAQLIRSGDRRQGCIGALAFSFCGVTYKVVCPFSQSGVAATYEEAFRGSDR